MKTKVTFYQDCETVDKIEFFNEDGNRHRSDGPAVICYNKEGRVRYREYWVEGKEHSITTFHRHARNVKRGAVPEDVSGEL
jgi:hypothetical protein